MELIKIYHNGEYYYFNNPIFAERFRENKLKTKN